MLDNLSSQIQRSLQVRAKKNLILINLKTLKFLTMFMQKFRCMCNGQIANCCLLMELRN